MDYSALPLCVQCFRVSIPLAVRHTLLQQMDMGSLTYTHIWVRAIHMKGIGHKQAFTRVDSEGYKNCPSPCPTRRSNPGSSDLKPDTLTTELILSPILDKHKPLWGTTLEHVLCYKFLILVKIVSISSLKKIRLTLRCPINHWIVNFQVLDRLHSFAIHLKLFTAMLMLSTSTFLNH